MAIRSLHSDVRNALLTGESFTYAHLVKFERPIVTTSGKSARDATDYVYLTDGSYDIEFDDGSENIQGTSNGTQTYIANKVMNVGSIQETIEARATAINLQVSGAAFNTELESTFNITSSTITSSQDLVAAGFREGDIVKFVATSGSNKDKTARINSFTTNNTVANITPLSVIYTENNASYTLTFNSPEVEGIITSKSSGSYANYINREVFIYKAFMSPETGQIIGEPYLLFKGIISGGKISEDPDSVSKISWNITSHWGDFSRVQGRLTADGSHRGLKGDGTADPEAAIRPAYTGDLGFLHSEQAINLMATYQVKETRQDLKMKRKWYGSKKYKLIEYEVEVDRQADLKFNLQARYLPVVYGVNKIDSIPVFADSLNSDSREVFVAYAICEGRVGGLYDVYFDDLPRICTDANDSSTRGSQTNANNVDIVCFGRMDRGDTLNGTNINSSTTAIAPSSSFANGSDDLWQDEYTRTLSREEYPYNVPLPYTDSTWETTNSTSTGIGIQHERGISFDTPIDSRNLFHSGLPDQKADTLLLNNANNFKVGTDYYSGNEPYWGAQHRLLDTAYFVSNYSIGEGETTIPSLDFVIRGKGVECYNYDFSYVQDPAYSSDTTAAFNIGDEVDIYDTSTDMKQNGDTPIVIADMYPAISVEGVTETRVRFKTDPLAALGSFYMKKGTDTFHLAPGDYTAHTGTCPGALQEEVTSVSNTAVSGGTGVDVTAGNGSTSSAFTSAASISTAIAFSENINGAFFSETELDTFFPAEGFNTSTATFDDIGSAQTGSSNLVSTYITIMDGMRLSSGAVATDDAYNGYFVEVTHTYPDNTTLVQKKKIIDYDGATKTIQILGTWEKAPVQNDTYRIYPFEGDVRVTLNPAMQLVDYLMSPRYGKNLTLAKTSIDEGDIDGPSAFKAARDCDTRSNIHVLTSTTGTISEGTFYKYSTSSGKTLFHGKVHKVTQVGSYQSIEFSEVLGKLAHRWENWKYFATGELYYYEGALHKASSDGVISSTPSTTASVSASDAQLTRVSSSGGPSLLQLDYSSSRATFDGDPIVKRYSSSGNVSSGYELYDADDVKYWRYLGWDSQNQRHVTRHQTNTILDTAVPVFDNINSLLKHFNGVLRYSSGKYALSVMKTADPYTTVSVGSESYTVELIEEGDIIGSINVEDAGQKGTFNQVDVSINDPQNKFEGRSITMFDSTYLKQDRMVPRKGNFQTPYITNYYNARINAKQYLEQSRNGLKISFTMAPKGALLLAGEVISLNYSRFGWNQKQFRITNLTVNQNCLVKITAEEHSDDTYIVGQAEPGRVKTAEPINNNTQAPGNPSSLSASQDESGGVILNWVNADSFDRATYSTEIWASDDNNRQNASLVATTKANSYTYSVLDVGSVTKFFWVRHVVVRNRQHGAGVSFREHFSQYEPSGETSGVSGTADTGVTIDSVTRSGDELTFTFSDGTTDSFTVNGIASASSSGGVLTITYDDGTTSTVNDGTSISSITRSGETVTVQFDDGTSSTFTVADGADAIVGAVEYVANSNITKNSDGTYTSTHIDIEAAFFQGNTTVAKRRYRLSQSSGVWSTTVADRDQDTGDETNVSRLTPSLTISGKTASLVVTYSHDGIISKISAPAFIVEDGIGIASVNKTGSTVTVTYDDNTTDDFTVNGVASVTKNGGTLTITYDDNTTSTIDDGNGISSVSRSGDVVTVTYDDSTTNTFTVTDGTDAIVGYAEYVSVSNITKSSSGAYSASTLDVDFEFRQGTTLIAKRRYRVSRNGDGWSTTVATRDGDITDETNVSRLTPSLTASGTDAVLTVTYSHDSITSLATAPFTLVLDGLGIASVAKSGSTVTVTYDDGTTDDFTVNGVSNVVKNGDVLTITYDDNTTSTINDGDDGNGIASITKSGTTVTVVFDDSTQTTFTVEDGAPAVSGDPDYVTSAAITKNSSGAYSANHLDIDFEFLEGGETVLARRRYRIARSGDGWGSITARDGDITNELNTSRLTATAIGSGQDSGIRVTYSHAGVTSRATAPVSLHIDGAPGVDGVAVNLTASPVIFTRDASFTYDPDGASNITLTCNGGTVTGVTWSTTAGTLASSTGNSGNTLTFAQNQSKANAQASATVTAVVTGTDSEGNTGQSFGTYTVKIPVTIEGGDGSNGDRGEKVITGFMYYQTAQSTAPTVPATSILSVNWSTGVVSSSNSNWDVEPPTFEAGSANTYWFFSFTAAESGTYNSGTDSYSGTTKTFNPTTNSDALKGIGFQNLVTFSSLSNTGTTQIDGSRITTGQIDAQRLNVTQINVGDLVNDAQYQSNALTSSAQINVTQTLNYEAPPTDNSQLLNGAQYQTQAFTQPGQINVTQTLNYAAPPGQVSQLQNDSNFQSGLTNLNQFSNATTNFQSGLEQLSQFQNDSNFQTAAFTEPGQINVTQTTNYQAPPTDTNQLQNSAGFQTQAIEFSGTAISGGKIGLSSTGLIIGNSQVTVASNNSIILDTTQGNNAISVYDGTTLRVKIGKL